jgi:hypothetical protein
MSHCTRALVIGATLCLLACGGPGGITVPADQTWTDTGVRVAVGQELQITARGTVHAGPALSCGPEGFANRPDWDRYSVISGAPHIALIGRIGSDGEPFYVGASYTGRADRSGTLYFGVNDRDAANNRGSYAATIEVR